MLPLLTPTTGTLLPGTWQRELPWIVMLEQLLAWRSLCRLKELVAPLIDNYDGAVAVLS